VNQKHAQCLICGATALKALPEYAKDHLVQCSSCHFVFSHLIPGTEELNEYYKNYGSGQHEAISPITIKRYHELLDQFERYRKYGTLLDVGCGSGHFLATAKERGWQVYGTEFPESLCDVCRKKGLTVHRGVLNTANYPNMQFDVLTSFEVIEHINNPLEELAKFQQLLRPGGLFYCTTPNFNSLQRYQLGPDWNVFAYPEHISYYTRSTLAEVARRSGFKPLTIQTTGFSFSRAKSKTLKREHVTGKGSPDELARQAIEGNAGLRLAKSAVNQVLSVTGTGATLKGYFKRL
jgi:2-polyprenyl-3-methyl-5-hydroxy-6-metoxy-1,4-benzoquinol methylase